MAKRSHAEWHTDTSRWLDAFEGLRKALAPGPHWNIVNPPNSDPGYSTAWVIRRGDYVAPTPRKPCRKVNRNR